MKLAKREKYLVYGTACAITIFLLFEFLIFPVFEKKERFQRGIREKEIALKEILTLSADYQAYQNSTKVIKEILNNRKKGFTLFSYLEGAAGKAGVKDHIKYMKPNVSKGIGSNSYKESTVEIKLEGVTLKQLIGFLYRIESPENIISIKRISIKKNKQKTGYLDTIMQVLTFK